MKADRKNSKKFEHIGGILQKILKTCRPETNDELIKIWDNWERVVGKAIFENARPAALKGKILLVHVASATWTHHLQFLKKDLIHKINATLGKELVKEIKFKTGTF
ncbi:MAG: DUF721 domain-containing protein [Desulfobacterales bacterium]|nr:DUF721 domain-containing protein [Desulfobacterales bacterium]